MRTASGKTALPESPPVVLASMGRRVFRSMRMARTVFISDTPSAPASSHARAIAAMSVTLGVSLTITGFFTARFTARVTDAAPSQVVPKPMPPPWTLGQLTFISSQPTSGQASNFSATLTYSPTEKPQTLAMTLPLKMRATFGSSRSMTASTPGFCSPTLLSRPDGASAMRGAAFP